MGERKWPHLNFYKCHFSVTPYTVLCAVHKIDHFSIYASKNPHFSQPYTAIFGLPTPSRGFVGILFFVHLGPPLKPTTYPLVILPPHFGHLLAISNHPLSQFYAWRTMGAGYAKSRENCITFLSIRSFLPDFSVFTYILALSFIFWKTFSFSTFVGKKFG